MRPTELGYYPAAYSRGETTITLIPHRSGFILVVNPRYNTPTLRYVKDGDAGQEIRFGGRFCTFGDSLWAIYERPRITPSFSRFVTPLTRRHYPPAGQLLGPAPDDQELTETANPCAEILSTQTEECTLSTDNLPGVIPVQPEDGVITLIGPTSGDKCTSHIDAVTVTTEKLEVRKTDNTTIYLPDDPNIRTITEVDHAQNEIIMVVRSRNSLSWESMELVEEGGTILTTSIRDSQVAGAIVVDTRGHWSLVEWDLE